MGSHQKHEARADDLIARQKAAAMIKAGTNLCPCGRRGTWQMLAGRDVHWRCDDCRAREERVKPPRAAPGPVCTFGDLLRDDGPNMVRACCGGMNCTYERALPLAPFAILWGLDASTDRLREALVCQLCGHKGVRIIRPSCNGKGEAEVFPT